MQGSGALISWLYDFGDGQTLQVNAPSNPDITHIYANSGTFSATLIVTDINGCQSNTALATALVNPIPTAAFTFDTVCFNLPTHFSDLSASGAGLTSWSWNFGDGTSTQQNPSHIFSSAGLHSVKLIVSDAIGCSDSLTHDVLVWPLPQPAFTYVDSCSGTTLWFTDQSTPMATGINSWNWNFGDGYSSTLQNPQHTFALPNTFYPVTLTVVNTNGCQNNLTQNVVTASPMGADFSFNQACLGSPTLFTASSSLPPAQIAEVIWFLGDGSTATGLSVTHTYASAGYYNVIMVMKSTSGCEQTVSKIVSVIALPQPSFSWTSGCPGDLTYFTDQSISIMSPIVSWNWDFGDGSVSGLQHPTHTYLTPGTYTVALTVTNANGCSATVQQQVTIDPLPLALFSWTGVCVGAPTQFTDLSNGYSYPIQQWYWDFGDGWFSNLQNPSHTFSAAGTYNVSLQVWNAQGCTQDTTLAVTIHTNPTAWFSFTTACVGSSTAFTDESSSGVPINQWAWNFGDGNSSSLQNPQHIFSGVGPYNVQLTVTDINGCSSQATRPVSNYPKPNASFTYTGACVGSAIQFNDVSVGNGSLIVSWLWDFGDGQQSTSQNPTHVYITPGTYTVTLVVTTEYGCSDTVVQTVSPYTPPTANFTWNSPCVLTATQFTDQSVPGSGNIGNYLWTIDNVWNSLLQNPSYSFTTTGLHTVSLVVTDIYGCKDTLEQSILIDSLPIADFAWNASCPNTATQFTDLSNPTGSFIASWNWTFGDGAQSTLQNPSHIYGQGGFYTVKLSVAKANGCSSTAIKTIVLDSIPEAHFTYDTACTGLPTHFYDLTTVYGYPIIQYQWDFGDPASGANNTSSVQNPEHIFTSIGTYQVRLVVINALGCTDTIVKLVNTFPGPVADFTYDTACYGQPTQLTDLTTSVSPVVTWDWDFGGGIHSSLQNPTYTFPTYGQIPVTLTITNQNGCVASVTKNVLVDQLPMAGFTWNNPCNTNIVQFTDTTVITTSPIISWLWDFGDGSYSTQQNPQHVFVPNQSYNVTLTVSTQAGCSDSHSETISILPGWSVDFVYDTVCLGDSTHFTAQMLTPGVNVASVQWNFGDGTSGSGMQVSHKYNLPGIYQVMLQITDTAGCTQGSSHLVEVYPLPQPAFTFQSTCADSTMSFFDQTPGPISQWLWDFGDGNTSNLQNPIHTYASAGNYTVSLTVNDGHGCQNQTSQLLVLFAKPTAAFSASTACLGSPTQFTDQSFTNSGNITSWMWNFGDGSQSSLQNPSYTYTSPGTYLATLIVTNSLGCADSVTLPVQVLSLPTAGFTFTNACMGSGTQFTDQSTSINGSITQWLWNFGDGNGSNLQNPVHTYPFAGTFNTTLTVTDATGCQATIIQPVDVLPLPTAQFSFLNNLCGNTEVQFTDQSLGNGAAIISWLWDFGDGGTSGDQHPVHLYTSPGTYVVTLQVTNANGCSHSINKPLVNGTPPVAAFSYANNCYPQATQFTDQSLTTSGSIVQWKWNFGDPASGASNTSTLQNPTHVFSAPGVYTVQLIIVTSSACSDTIWQTLNVEPGPTADFSFSTTCVGNATSFTDLSTPSVYPIVSWLWDFGDGNTSSQPNPSHTYLLGGQYMVTLTVTDANGCQASRTRMVPVNNLPTAQFQFSNECQNQNTYFTDYSNGAGAAITAWAWDFGDPISGGNNYSALQNPTHIYTSTGLYQVTLTITNANGCSNSITQPVLIIPSPVADFEADTACSGSPIYFNNLSYSVGSNINQWYWDFGDGTSSTLPFPYHTFPGPGVYNVSLTVTNTNGCIASVLKPVTVNPLPLVNFDYLRPNCAGDSTRFINLTSFAGGGGAANYTWNFGDGTSSHTTNPVHLYPSAGIYTVTLTVSDNNGCTNAKIQNITVYSSPNAAFIFNNLTCNDVQFTDMSYDPQLNINSWYWNFNDPGSGSANLSTLQNPVHTFSQPGSFNVRLMVVNSEGCSDTTFRNVEIAAPVANFSIDSSTLCAGAGTQFIDLSYSNYGTITSRLWNFGDGSTSTQPNPIHQYSAGGIYWVTLTIQTSLGCSATVTKQVTINNQPIANFSYTAPNCPDQSISFTDLSSAAAGSTIIQWNWDFGNGNTSTLQNPTQAFNTPGNYLVQLQITDNRGCQATRIRQVKVYASPEANFNTSITQCNHVSFTDLSLSQDTLINAWLWNFGDPASGFNNVSTLNNPVHIYNQPGTYQVTLVVWTAAGCVDTAISSLTITTPQANFTYTTGCQGDLTQFTDLSINNGVPITQWQWQFGDGGTSTSQNPVHTYQNSGIYLVSLLITNSQGCQSNGVKQVTIPSSPIADFTFDTPCQGNSTHFMDASLPAGNTPIVSWYWDFGDGNNSTSQNPAHLYTLAGIYNVSLQVTDANGCISSKNQQVTVYGVPLANFNYSIPQCDTVFFTDASAGGGSLITLWRWNFGDPASGMFNTSTQQNPWHVYTLPGTYQVRLIVTNSNGCSDTLTKPVIFDPFPQPDFSFDIACSGDTTHFQALNTAPNVVSYAWDFGDGDNGSGPAPVHVYASPGTYSVTLVVTNNNLCSNYITKAVPVIPTPSVNFTWNPQTCAGAGVSFVNQTQGNGGTVTQYLWRFGDGNTSTQANPIHTYTSAGTYQVTLIAWNSNNCVDSLRKTITIHPLPVADFTSTTVCKGQATQFTDLSQPQGSTITGWLWNFGDGSTLSGIQNPQHVYASPGSYNVTLTVTAANGCQATDMGTALVNALPVVNFTTQSDTLCAQDTVFFTNLTTPLAGSSFLWYFGDPASGTADTSTLMNPFHVYNAAGNYTVSLMATTASGCQSDASRVLTIRPKPTVNFIYTTACSNDTTYFTDLSYTPGGTAITAWNWDFGDGATSTLQHPTHVYSSVVNDTTFTVTLTAYSSFGCSNMQTQQVPVYGPPVAAFSAAPVCQGMVTYFTSQATTPSGIITSWNWDFGDGTNSTLPNPTHLYAQADTFMVRLIVSNSNGCFDTTLQPVIVYPLPLADFAYDTVCFGDTTHFTDLSFLPYGELNSWYWSFGDPMSGVYDTSTMQNPAHKYTHPGLFMVTLMVGDTNGCAAFITLPVKVDSLPIPQFAYTPATCQNTAISFTDQSQTTDNPIASWTWRFGDGSDTTIYAPNSPNIQHIYTNLGLYIATLTTTDIRGCTDSVSHVLEIYPLPNAAFTYKDTTCTAGLVYFKDESVGVGTNVTSWMWDFNYPGQSYSTQQNPYYFYPITNTSYTVMLAITDARGCRDTVFDTIFVKHGLEVDFTLQNNCYGDTVIFTPQVILPLGDTLLQTEWTFGDGQTSTQYVGRHVYSQPGLYYVQMKAWNQNGCQAMAFKPILVDQPPLVAFTAPPAGCQDPTVFTDFSQPNSDSIVSWHWKFGDGNDTLIFAPNSPNLTHLYGEEGGVYQASLTVTNSNGCSATLQQEVIRFSCLQAGFNANPQVCSGQPVVIIDMSAAGSGAVNISNWYWDLGDGTQISSPVRLDTLIHTYNNHGSYTIRQIITANTGSTLYMDTAEMKVTVYPGPRAGFVHTPSCYGVPVVFQDQTLTPGAPLTQWLWNFGDGTTSSLQNPVHQFADTSSYTVILSVANTFGCTDTASKVIKPALLPGAMLAAPGTVFCADTLTLTLSETSNQQANRYVWNFGDGTTVETTIPQVEHSFVSGTWNVMLTVYSNAECPNADTLQITIHSLPVAEFSFKPDSIRPLLEEARFLDASFGTSSTIKQWYWTFGDGRDTLAMNPLHKFADTGNYAITLRVTDENGCVNQITKNLRVYPELRFFIPNAFTPNQNGRNEVFRPLGKYLKPGKYLFQIYNRWGELLFETTDPNEGWDGKFKGVDSPVGVYIWTITVYDMFNDKEFYKGSVLLLR
ncbi:MAG: PKD domain-containing protein [Bacteroidales bacterium]